MDEWVEKHVKPEIRGSAVKWYQLITHELTTLWLPVENQPEFKSSGIPAQRGK